MRVCLICLGVRGVGVRVYVIVAMLVFLSPVYVFGCLFCVFLFIANVCVLVSLIGFAVLLLFRCIFE